jgi:hypothetical protein
VVLEALDAVAHGGVGAHVEEGYGCHALSEDLLEFLVFLTALVAIKGGRGLGEESVLFR